MRVPLRSGPPKAENCAEGVFEELRSCHVRTAFPQVDLGPILEARRRPSTGQWLMLLSSTNYTTFIQVAWGVSSDILVPADYDGDGKADPAVYRPSTGQWLMLNSNTNYTTFTAVSWGTSTDVPLQGDYDGDRRADPAVFRPSTGQWLILPSSTNY